MKKSNRPIERANRAQDEFKKRIEEAAQIEQEAMESLMRRKERADAEKTPTEKI